MKIPFREARLKPLIVGTLKYSDYITNLLPVAAGGTRNSRYCYSVWMRHLKFLSGFNNGLVPQKIAELGPGDSVGVGLAALLSGVQSYFALDVIKYWNNERNLRILDELLVLFHNKEKIPGAAEFPLLQPLPVDFDFPREVVTDEILKYSLDPARVAAIRSELSNPGDAGNTLIHYKIPWHDKAIIQPESLDYIFSHTVLQHIGDIENAYSAIGTWLKPSGFVTHLVDYKSMGFTGKWNGHWTFSDWEWKMMVGGRKFSINRMPHSKHMQLLRENNFNLLFARIQNNANTLDRNRLAKKYRSLSDDDLTTSGAFIVAQKSAHSNNR